MSDHLHLGRRDDPQARDLTLRHLPELAMRAASLNEQERSIEAIVATETPALVYDWQRDQVIEEVLRMDGCELGDGMPLLADHARWSIDGIRGSVRQLRRDGAQLIGRLYFADDEDSQRAWSKVKGGHLRSVSVGYRVLAYEDLHPGETRDVGGKPYTATTRRLRVTTRWAPYETSLVPVGADPNARMRAAHPSTPTASSTPTPKDTSMRFDEWLASRGIDHTKLNAAQRAALEADFAAMQRAAAGGQAAAAGQPAAAPAAAPAPTAPAAGADESARAAGIAQERQRVADIRAAGEGLDADMVNRAISEGWTVQRATTEFLVALRAQRGTGPAAGGAGVRAEVTAANEDKFQRAAANALLMRAGFAARVDAAAQSECTSLRGAGLQDLARAALAAHRVEIPHDAEQLFRRSISTSSFPTALGNTLNRVLQAAFEDYPSTALEWAQRVVAKDFREHKSIVMGRFSRPEKVGKGGEVKHGTLGEEAEGYSVDTFGTLFALTRKDFINDDLGIFTTLPQKLGSSMKMNIDDVVYALLISGANSSGPTLDSDSKQLFAADHIDAGITGSAIVNLLTGGGSALASAGLSAAKQAMRKVKHGGREINVTPRFLLAPPELEQTALELLNSDQILIATGENLSQLRGNKNVHQGTLRPIIEPRLSAATNGTTAWYLIAEWMRAAHIGVCFLQGQENPQVERKDPADVLGLGWLAYHDVGADALGFRGIQRNRGA